MKLFYGRKKPKGLTDFAFRNARLFSGVEEGVTAVMVEGEYSDIEQAYRDAGIRVMRKGALAPPPASLTEKLAVPSDAEMRQAIESATGKRPAWNLKPETLRARFKALTGL